MLGITVPLIVVFADFFEFGPLIASHPEEGGNPPRKALSSRWSTHHYGLHSVRGAIEATLR